MTWTIDELKKLSPSQRLLDVRTPQECAAGVIPGAMQLPVDQIHARAGEFSKEHEYLVYCRSGKRGELACAILKKSGIRCRNLSGGYLAYESHREG